MHEAKKQSIRQTINQVIENGPFKPERVSLEKYQCPDWYRNGKFGIFIHWGVYSVPAFGNEWYPKDMYDRRTPAYEHHRRTYGKLTEFGYKDFIPMFKAEKFDAAAWAELFREAGARFVVPVAEHHDGFAMYATELNKWNAAEMGPRRDIIAELSTAIRDENMMVGLSSHRAEHYWFFNQGLLTPSDVQDPEYSSLYGVDNELPYPEIDNRIHAGSYNQFLPSPVAVEDWLVRTCEFVDKFRPQLVWFDWWICNAGYAHALREFAAFYYNRGIEWGIGVAINYKYQALTPDCATFDIERGQLSDIYPQFWQNDTSVSKNSWGYVHNQNYKKSNEIISDLADVVSKNGALLLNIGPKPDGTIPDEEQRMLREIGAWLKVNGEAIYDTRPYLVFGEGPTRVASGAFTDTSREGFTSSDIRFTCRENAVYAIAMRLSTDGIFRSHALAMNKPSAPCRIQSVELLGHGEVEFTWDTDMLQVKLPVGYTSEFPYVLKVNQCAIN